MPLAYAPSMALKKTYGIIRLTHDYWKSLPEDERQDTDDEKDAVEPHRLSRRMKKRELRIIQGQGIIREIGLGQETETDV